LPTALLTLPGDPTMAEETKQIDEKKKAFVEPTLTEQASLADVTLQSCGILGAEFLSDEEVPSRLA
jgi:hypothetical protein